MEGEAGAEGDHSPHPMCARGVPAVVEERPPRDSAEDRVAKVWGIRVLEREKSR